MAQESTQRNHSLDFLKIVATTIILFHHYQQNGGITFTSHPNFMFNPHFSWALMVELFFMLSGFVMYHYCDGRLETTPFASFMGRRCMRLLPPVAASVAVYFAAGFVYQQLHGEPFFFSTGVNLWGMVVSALGLQNGWGLNGWLMNNPTWYVSVLLLCYCWFYAVTRFSQKRRFPLVYAYLLVLAVCFAGVRLPLLLDNAARGLKCFFFGLLLAMFYDRFTLNRWLVTLCLTVMGIVALFITFAHSYTDYTMTFVYLFCPALILVLQTPAAQRLFRHGIWSRLSAVSYHVYVWHGVLLLVMHTAASSFWSADRPWRMYLFALMAWGLGALSRWLFDGSVAKVLPKVLHTVFEKKPQAEA